MELCLFMCHLKKIKESWCNIFAILFNKFLCYVLWDLSPFKNVDCEFKKLSQDRGQNICKRKIFQLQIAKIFQCINFSMCTYNGVCGDQILAKK